MITARVPREASFGYLSTWDSPEHGCVGGYLVVSPLGRPIEFHCTAPIRASRAQQILFGPALWSYVLGEQIGGSLLASAKMRSELILADHRATLCLRPTLKQPMLYLAGAVTAKPAAADSDATTKTMTQANEPVARPPERLAVRAFAVGKSVFEPGPSFESDEDAARPLLELLMRHVDLAEPFQRIRDAIREALRLGDRFGEAHENAA
jgi:hypothetical protein